MKKMKFLIPIIMATVLVMAFKFQESDSRTVKAIHKPVRSDIGDLITYRVMPTRKVPIDKMDPFLFLNHHGPQVYAANNEGLPFGPHPHKGFETVTFILDGSLVHSDNSGHKSEITAGGVQWMTAGKGIVHSEMSSEEFQKQGGSVEMLQLWVNLPAEKKNLEPAYTGLQKDEIPVLNLDNGKVKLHLISGSWNERNGPINSATGVMMSWMKLSKDGEVATSVGADREIFLYVVDGELEINGRNVGTRSLVEFEKDGEKLNLKALKESTILFGHAEPTNDPIVAEGPFVMNSKEEIRQAHKDYSAGKFGRPIDDH